MKLGLVVRNMGPASSRDLVTAAAQAADACPAVDNVWVVDHVAIPPDQSEGSGGRYLEPLATLAYLAGVTRRVGARSAPAGTVGECSSGTGGGFSAGMPGRVPTRAGRACGTPSTPGWWRTVARSGCSSPAMARGSSPGRGGGLGGDMSGFQLSQLGLELGDLFGGLEPTLGGR